MNFIINPYRFSRPRQIEAPGEVILGTPTPNGIPLTMPSLPAGAGSMTLQTSNDDSTWYTIFLFMDGGESNTLILGYDSGPPEGHANELTYFRAVNTIGGATGP